MFKTLVILVLVVTPIIGVTQEKSPSEVAFERLKELAGTWEAVDKVTSRKITVRYTVKSGGKLLVEDLDGLITTFYRDKDTVLLTHFCVWGNQPRLKLKSVTDGGRRLSFDFLDITNLQSPDAYRTTTLEVIFKDDGTADVIYGGWGKASGTMIQTTHLLRRTSTK